MDCQSWGRDVWKNKVREMHLHTFQYELNTWNSILISNPLSNLLSDGDLQAAYYVDAAACWTDVNDNDGMSE